MEAFVCRLTISFFAFTSVVFVTAFFGLTDDVTEEVDFGVGEDDFCPSDGAKDFFLLTDCLGLCVVEVLDTVGVVPPFNEGPSF